MSRRALQGIVCAVVIALTCGLAAAEERIEGDGYSLRIPGGFRRVPIGDCGT